MRSPCRGPGTCWLSSKTGSRIQVTKDNPGIVRLRVTYTVDNQTSDPAFHSIEFLPPVYYVIVGRGPMAVVNHSTLRESNAGKKRLAELPVLHIGFPNPWPKYLEHGLGQPNHLLSLPGFQAKFQPSGAGPEKTLDGGLNSQFFGACVDKQLKDLQEKYEVEVIDGWVALIQAKDQLDQAPDVEIAEPRKEKARRRPQPRLKCRLSA